MTDKELNTEVAVKLMGLDAPLESDYVNNIADAIRLLTAIHSKGWFWRLDSVHDGVICTLQNIKRKTYSVRAPTMARAICECALRTVIEDAQKEVE